MAWGLVRTGPTLTLATDRASAKERQIDMAWGLVRTGPTPTLATDRASAKERQIDMAWGLVRTGPPSEPHVVLKTTAESDRSRRGVDLTATG